MLKRLTHPRRHFFIFLFLHVHDDLTDRRKIALDSSTPRWDRVINSIYTMARIALPLRCSITARGNGWHVECSSCTVRHRSILELFEGCGVALFLRSTYSPHTYPSFYYPARVINRSAINYSQSSWKGPGIHNSKKRHAATDCFKANI